MRSFRDRFTATALTAYDHCYSGGQRIALPYEGGVLDQPAILLTAMDVIASTLATESRASAGEQAGKARRKRRRRPRG